MSNFTGRAWRRQSTPTRVPIVCPPTIQPRCAAKVCQQIVPNALSASVYEGREWIAVLEYFCRAELHAGRLHRANGAAFNKCNMRSELCSNARPGQLSSARGLR